MVMDTTHVDDWANDILGMGGTKDPSAYTTYGPRSRLADPTLEALYVEEHFAAMVIEAVVKSAMRRGWDLSMIGDPQKTGPVRDAYAMREDELGVAREMMRAACLGRLFGGAVNWIGADDGRAPAEPLDERAVRSVVFLHTFDRRDVQPCTYYQDPGAPRFGLPETYRITPYITAGLSAMNGGIGGVVVHESRCVVWGGQHTSERRQRELGGWDDSVLERCWVPLRQLGEDFAAKSLLLGRISQMVYKIKDLYSKMADPNNKTLVKRMGLLDASRSRSRAVLLDASEDAISITQPVAGVDTLIDKAIARLANSAENMPVSILLGQSPDSSARADQDAWDDQVRAWQEQTLRPRHERIARIIMLAKDGPTFGEEPAKYRIAYRALRVPSPKEAAEVAKLYADTDAINIDKGVYTADDAALARHTSLGEGEVRLEGASIKEKIDRRRAAAEQPPKDNAELGTVGARAGGGQRDILKDVNQGFISRQQGKAILMLTFRLTDEEAETMLGDESFVATPVPAKTTPGPSPEPAKGTGAGAPQGLPGFNAGGAPAPGAP